MTAPRAYPTAGCRPARVRASRLPLLVAFDGAIDEAGELGGPVRSLVEKELQPGCVAQLQAATDFASQEAPRACETRLHVLRGILGGERNEEHSCVPHVATQGDSRDRDVANPRVLDLARDDLGQDPLDLSFYAPAARIGHVDDSTIATFARLLYARSTRSGRRLARPGSSSRRYRIRFQRGPRLRHP